MRMPKLELSLSLNTAFVRRIQAAATLWAEPLLFVVLTLLSTWLFSYFLNINLGLAYNDARSHLDIGRRVVEGLKPGLAQLGSVWLPLPHVLMVPTIWNDFFWHSGLSGAIQSMAAFVLTSIVIFRTLKVLEYGVGSRIFAVAVFVLNMNVLYLQSTAMTELLLLGTMTTAVYELLKWHKTRSMIFLVKTAFWIMLATLVRYDGWFLFIWTIGLVGLQGFQHENWKFWQGLRRAEGLAIFYCTLAGLGIILWVLWNFLIFGDPLFFIFGPYSAHAQQSQLESAGVLISKHDLFVSLKTYWYAMIYNIGIVPVLLGLFGAISFFFAKNQKLEVKLAMTALMAPLAFNIVALFLGHSVLFVQGINGDTWFNVRYGIMMIPSVAVFSGILFARAKQFRVPIVVAFIFFSIFHIGGWDAVTIDDGRVGSSQKNVSQVSGWLKNNVTNSEGFVLISAASHDAIIFSSGLPMARFIHEGTGTYWDSATTTPDRWAKWIVMRTNDINDSTFRLIQQTPWQEYYQLVDSYPFADIYELKPEYWEQLNTKPTLPKQR